MDPEEIYDGLEEEKELEEIDFEKPLEPPPNMFDEDPEPPTEEEGDRYTPTFGEVAATEALAEQGIMDPTTDQIIDWLRENRGYRPAIQIDTDFIPWEEQVARREKKEAEEAAARKERIKKRRLDKEAMKAAREKKKTEKAQASDT